MIAASDLGLDVQVASHDLAAIWQKNCLKSMLHKMADYIDCYWHSLTRIDQYCFHYMMVMTIWFPHKHFEHLVSFESWLYVQIIPWNWFFFCVHFYIFIAVLLISYNNKGTSFYTCYGTEWHLCADVPLRSIHPFMPSFIHPFPHAAHHLDSIHWWVIICLVI